MLTRYDTEKSSYYDFCALLKAHLDEEVNVTTAVGRMDITDWRRVRRDYESSYVKICHPDGSTETTVMNRWQPRSVTGRKVAQIYVIPQATECIDYKAEYADRS